MRRVAIATGYTNIEQLNAVPVEENDEQQDEIVDGRTDPSSRCRGSAAARTEPFSFCTWFHGKKSNWNMYLMMMMV